MEGPRYYGLVTRDAREMVPGYLFLAVRRVMLS